MNAKTTLLLLATCIPLGIWVWSDLNRETQPPSNMGPLLPDLPASKVTRIVIERGDGALEAGREERLVFEERAGQWWITEPVEDVAERVRIVRLAEQASTRWTSSYVGVGEELARFGTGTDSIRVSFFYPEGQATIRIGRRTAYRRGVYAMVEGAARVGLLDRDFGDLFQLPVDRYRRSRAIVFDPEAVKTIDWRVLERTDAGQTQARYRFAHSDSSKSPWALNTGVKTIKIPDSLMDEFLTDLADIKVKGYLSTGTAFDLRAPGITCDVIHHLELHLKQRQDRPVGLALGVASHEREKKLLFGVSTRKIWGISDKGLPPAIPRILQLIEPEISAKPKKHAPNRALNP